MDENQVKLYYEELRKSFIKPETNWAEKGPVFRNLLEGFFKAMTPLAEGEKEKEFFEAIDLYYDRHPEQEGLRNTAHDIRKKLNSTVHRNVVITEKGARHWKYTKEQLLDIYRKIVLIIFSATEIAPDASTQEILGINSSDDLTGLNDQQKDAVICQSRIVLVNAGPGTGKTKLLAHKLVHYIRESNVARKIVALSYTNTAAGELGARFQQLAFNIGLTSGYDLFNGTIHAFCLKMLKTFGREHKVPFNQVIIGEEEIVDLSVEVCNRLDGKYTQEEVKSFLTQGNGPMPTDVAEKLEEVKVYFHIMTITDILKVFLRKLREENGVFLQWVLSRIDFIVVDEAQDLQKLNYEIFDALLTAKQELSIFLVGDPRQNIFEFNGGSFKNLSSFIEKFKTDVEVLSLSTTYRCPKAIANYVNTFNFTDCQNIPLFSSKEDNGSVSVTEFPTAEEEYASVIRKIKDSRLDDCTVISPTISGLAGLITALNASKIPFKVYGGRRKLRNHIRIINHFFRIIQNNNDNSIRSVARAFNVDIITQPLGAPRQYSARELFYRSPFGRKLRSLSEEATRQEWNPGVFANELVNTFFSNEMKTEEAVADINVLENLISGYPSPTDYLSAFELDKERFARFYDKPYEDCLTVPKDGIYLTLSTIHSAKGLQWKNVFLTGMCDSNFPATDKYRFKTEKSRDAFVNTRLKEMFVACTRAEDCLFISFPSSMEGKAQSASVFLKGLPVQKEESLLS